MKQGFDCVFNIEIKCEILELVPLVHDLVFTYPRYYTSYQGLSIFSSVKWSDNSPTSQGYFKD